MDRCGDESGAAMLCPTWARSNKDLSTVYEEILISVMLIELGRDDSSDAGAEREDAPLPRITQERRFRRGTIRVLVDHVSPERECSPVILGDADGPVARKALP